PLSPSEVKVLERNVGDLLAFIRRLTSNPVMLGNWPRSAGSAAVDSGRSRLRLAASTRVTPLPAAGDRLADSSPAPHAARVRLFREGAGTLMQLLAANMWQIPHALAERNALQREAELDSQMERLTGAGMSAMI
ncbi:uncharacterized protein LOC120349025, partial [Nilaparvata lugens]|uniref:uncharacterized protein LOC120349025 n=1 Tax=Nilaparvata lugens TaxID=108931 RepID=UPI00193CCE64